MCIKESWEIELGTQSHVMEGVVDETGDGDVLGGPAVSSCTPSGSYSGKTPKMGQTCPN